LEQSLQLFDEDSKPMLQFKIDSLREQLKKEQLLIRAILAEIKARKE
jgi:hypothetical protein